MPRPSITDLFHIEENSEILSVFSAVPIDLADFVVGSRSLEIYGDEVILNGSHTIPGREITIACRVLTCGAGATIDVSGLQPNKNYRPGQKPQTPGEPGKTGATGGDGDKGGDGGRIRIAADRIVGDLTLIASGANGGRAQDGGDGSQGQAGPEGPIGKQDHTGDVRGLQGGRGHPGGPAGPAGISGAGGNGGSIYVQNRSVTGRLVARADGGAPGGLAVHGSPGLGGPGGLGGKDYICHIVHTGGGGPGGGARSFLLANQPSVPSPTDCWHQAGLEFANASLDWANENDTLQQRRMFYNNVEFVGFEISYYENGWHSRGPESNPGPDGEPVSAPSTTRNPGKNGEVDVGQDDYSALSALFSPDALTLIRIAAEKIFRDRSLDAARAAILLEWIANISSDSALEKAPAIRRSLGLRDRTASEMQIVKNSNLRSRTLLAQMQAGLDYYGLQRNYVPTLTVDKYSNTINLLIQSALIVENAYEQWISDAESKEIKISSLKSTVDEYDVLQVRADAEANNIYNSLGAIDAQIKTLLSKCIIQKRSLDAANGALQQALARLGSGCNYAQMLGVINVILAANTGVYASVLALSSGVSTAMQNANNEDFGGIIKQLSVAAKGLGNLRDDFDKLTSALRTDPESAKFVVHEDDYLSKSRELDQQLSDTAVARLPETKEFRRTLEAYRLAVQAKNEKQIEFSKMWLRLSTLNVEKAQRTDLINRARNRLAEATDPTSIVLKIVLESAQLDLKTSITALLNLENRAYEYWSLTERSLNFSDYKVALLSASQAQLERDVLASKESSFESAGQLVDWESVDLFGLVSQPEAQKFLIGEEAEIGSADEPNRVHLLTFSLGHSVAQLARWNALRITSVRIRLEGSRTGDGRLQYSLIHHGSAAVRTPGGMLRRYVHPMRKYSFGYDLADGRPTTEEDLSRIDPDFMAPSPFATWTLMVGENQNPDLDLSNCRNVTISFKGKYLA